MEKLLHERLREWAKFEPGKPLFPMTKAEEALGITDCTGAACETKIFEAIADEIERCYIPRPCDPDGKPWMVDDPCIAKDAEGVIAGFDGGDFINVALSDSKTHYWFDKRYVRRPAPKVLDADEVEIKVGDTVYRCSDGLEVRVKETFVTPQGIAGFTCKECGSVDAKCFTHEKPVFDAEGVRICKGDTVWTTVRCDKFTVTGFRIEYGTPLVICYDLGGKSWELLASDLTHKEPDSLEKLRDFANEHRNKTEYSNIIGEIADRITALIERGA